MGKDLIRFNAEGKTTLNKFGSEDDKVKVFVRGEKGDSVKFKVAAEGLVGSFKTKTQYGDGDFFLTGSCEQPLLPSDYDHSIAVDGEGIHITMTPTTKRFADTPPIQCDISVTDLKQAYDAALDAKVAALEAQISSGSEVADEVVDEVASLYQDPDRQNGLIQLLARCNLTSDQVSTLLDLVQNYTLPWNHADGLSCLNAIIDSDSFGYEHMRRVVLGKKCILKTVDDGEEKEELKKKLRAKWRDSISDEINDIVEELDFSND